MTPKTRWPKNRWPMTEALFECQGERGRGYKKNHVSYNASKTDLFRGSKKTVNIYPLSPIANRPSLVWALSGRWVSNTYCPHIAWRHRPKIVSPSYRPSPRQHFLVAEEVSFQTIKIILTNKNWTKDRCL